MSAMKFPKASILLGLFSASCGMLKLNVNGQPQGGGATSGGAAVAPSNPPGQADKTKLALPAKAEQKIARAALAPRLTTPAIKVAVESRADDLGFRCGEAHAQGYTTAAPAYSFEVTEAFDLQVRLTETWNGVEGILVFPDGSTQCNESDGKFLAQNWPVGTYHLFLVSSGSNAGSRVEFSSAEAASAAAPIITVTQPTSAPQHAEIEQITYVGGYNKVFNDSNYQLECTSSEVSDQPSAYIDFKAATPTTRVSVWGRNLNGFVYRFAGKSFIQCGSIAKPPQGGWPTGRVEIYPMARLNQKGDAFTVVVDDPQTPATDSQVQELVLDGKLASPKFVTVALRDGRWQDARPLPLNSEGDDFDPMFSADGSWLYFASNRAHGHGGHDLYRAAVLAGGGFGPAANLGAGVNGRGDERAPTPSRDGRHLLFASDGRGGAGGLDLFVARREGGDFVMPLQLPGINSAADEAAAAWLGDGAAIVFARSDSIAGKPVVLLVAQCEGARYVEAVPLALSFNRPDARTLGPTIDWNKPGELLVSGSAKAPRAGQLDIYRMRAPTVTGSPGCF